MSEFGIDRARQLAGESHATAQGALAEAAALTLAAGGGADTTGELAAIADFVYTRSS